MREAYAKHRRLVYAVALRIVGNPYDAEDVVHDVFVKLLSGPGERAHTAATSPAWLASVARNEALDHVRRRSRTPCVAVDLDAVPARAGSERGLGDALATLPRGQREAVVLRHIAGLRPREIAGRLVRTPASIHGLLHRAKASLRAELSACASGS